MGVGSPSRLRWLACAALSSATVAGCSHVIDGSAVRQPLIGEADCPKVAAPMTMILPNRDGEPLMRIPEPQDWQRTTMLDSEVIRYMMRNPSLAASAAVTIEDVTNTTETPQEIIAAEWAGATAVVGATDVIATSDDPVCGFPAQTVTFKVPTRGALPNLTGVSLCVVTTGTPRHAVVVTVQSANPDDPTYEADSRTILDGFQVMLERGGHT